MQPLEAFITQVWSYYDAEGRHDMPWRQPNAHGQFDPYPIMVSEIMLQQTQVARVIPKFQAFMQQFPNVQTLAAAPQATTGVLSFCGTLHR
jgi:A/G-specific adenine glycosylase